MATWGDYSLRALIKKIIDRYPLDVYLTEPVADAKATDSSVFVNVSILGWFGYLQRYDTSTNKWVNVAATGPFVTGSNYYVSVSKIETTSRCRVYIFPVGSSATSSKYAIYTNEFTVTRTSAQTQALKQNLASGKLDTDVSETDVVEKSIDTMETEPVVEKTTTTTKSK